MSSRRCKPTDSGRQNAFPALKGPDYKRQPLRGWFRFFRLLPVGFTYGYSRGGPLRGRIHLTFGDSQLLCRAPPCNWYARKALQSVLTSARF
jgi:hypothetical protein